MRLTNKELIEVIKAAGQEMIDRAEDFAGNGELITDITIWVRIDPTDEIPTIEVQREHLIKNSVQIITGAYKYKENTDAILEEEKAETTSEEN